MSARRGWRETIEPGIYRAHRVACASSVDHRPGRRCGCSFQIVVPGARPGATRLLTVSGTVSRARAERDRLRGEGRPESPSVVESGTLDELAGDYLRAKAPTLAPSTVAVREEAYRLRVSPALGDLSLADITRQSVEIWLAETLGTSSRHASGKALEALRVILNLGVQWGRISDSPAAGLRLPKVPRERHRAERVLDAAQLAALFEGTRRVHLESMLRMAGEAGLRRGEVIGLRWPDVDFSARRVLVARSVWQEVGRDGGPPRRIVGPPKSGRERRVAISAGLATRLARWYAIAVVEGGASADGYVWPARYGGPMDSGTPGQALARVLMRVGLVDATGRPLVSFHGLRHTAASIMLARGVPLIVVSRQLGHANPNITAQVYAHLLSDSQLDDAAAVFDPAPGTETLRDTLREIEAAPERRMDSGI